MLDCKSLPELDSERNLDQNPTMNTFVLERSDVDLVHRTTLLLRTPLVLPGDLHHPHFQLRRHPSPSERRVVQFPPLVSLVFPLAGKMATDQTFTTSTLNEDGQTSLVVSYAGRHVRIYIYIQEYCNKIIYTIKSSQQIIKSTIYIYTQ